MNENGNSQAGAVELRPRERFREQWHRLIEEQSASGLTVAEFCRRRSISHTAFYRWRSRRLADAQAPGGFVAVRLADERARPAAAVRGQSRLEVRLRGGRRLVVRDSFDRELLVELIAVLEGLA